MAQGFYPANPGVAGAVQYLQGQFVRPEAARIGRLAAASHHRRFQLLIPRQQGDLAVWVGRIIAHLQQGSAQQGPADSGGIEGPIAHHRSAWVGAEAHLVVQVIAAHLPAPGHPVGVAQVLVAGSS